MIDNEVLEGNILIAKFMGGVYYDSWQCQTYMMPYPLFAFVKEEVYIDARNLSYHSSWEDLMPVIQKIKRDKHDPKCMNMGTTLERHLKYENVLALPIYSSIESVYNQIVQFIKWYNQQSK